MESGYTFTAASWCFSWPEAGCGVWEMPRAWSDLRNCIIHGSRLYSQTYLFYQSTLVHMLMVLNSTF